jgi:hypothetical protein
MTEAEYISVVQERLAGQVVGCTGHEPYSETEIEKFIYYGLGIVGSEHIWQSNQIIVVGRSYYNRTFLRQSLEIGRRFSFTCRYMSQEDFRKSYLKGDDVQYYLNDPRIRKHDGLSFLASLNSDWCLPIPSKQVNWRILPPGEHPFQTVTEYYRQLLMGGSSKKEIWERLSAIEALGPANRYYGTDEFKGYLVFYFPDLGKAVLECPFEGNAIYVIDGDWETLSRYSKAKLLRSFSDEVKRVIHKGDWLPRLKKALGLMYR